MQKELLEWYRANKRDLPWRKNRNAYGIWISEVMLQQTTVAAVIPYYNKFIKRFPKVETLAQASEPEVLEMWAGLGYYSRARNLHKAAQLISKSGFPKTAAELIKLPGFGPYTSRAVASLAFNESVGVLDGNVIRVLSRVYGKKLNWWLPKERQLLQDLSDKLANSNHNSEINQGLMELGATICTPKKPLCVLCPWQLKCQAIEKNIVDQLPLARPRQKEEIWHWHLQVYTKNNKIYLQKNNVTPFLSDLLFPPGKAKSLKTKPTQYDIKHSVTKYRIYIKIENTPPLKPLKSNWFDIDHIQKINPTSLMSKILKKSINEVR